VSITIRLTRGGRVHLPFYHVSVFDRRTRRDGKPVEELGFYAPESEKEPVRLNAERIAYWLAQGADVSETAAMLLRKANIAIPARKNSVSKPKVSQGKHKLATLKARKTKKRDPKKARMANSKRAKERLTKKTGAA
jgi:small subunit ribosomal protein S16